MKSKTRLESAVFQLTPTRTRCDLYIIANGKKEKIASGLLNPFIAHLKAAQDQIAEGGYSVLLAPEAGSNATWFTKCTVESFVRFVSTPEILERVYTIESEILQIEEAIAIQGHNDISIKDQYIKPVASNEGNKSACDVEEEKAIVLYKPGAHELTTSPSAKERNSKVQLINVLETRKAVLKKEQGMAFARAVAAGFEIEHVANLLSFAECFGASRLMSGCLRFMDLWKQKHESGQWVEIEAEEAMSDCSASGIVLSSMANEPSVKARGGDAISETAGYTNAAGGEQQYHGGQHPGLPPWVIHSSPHGGVPVYPVPYYHHHHPGFYPPPLPYPSSPSIEDPSHFQKRQSMDNNRYNNTESEAGSEEESSEQRKSAGKKKPSRVVIRNINFINPKTQTSSDSASSDTDNSDHTQHQKRNLRSPKRKGNHKDSESATLNGKEADAGHWDAFQTYLLKSAAEGDHEDMLKTKRCQKTMAELAHAKHNDDGEGHMQSYDTSGRKILYRSAENNDDFMMVGRREETNVRDGNGFEEVNLDERNGLQHDEAVMVSWRSSSGVNDCNLTSGLKMFDLPENKSSKPPHVVKYEPDALSLMPEREVENIGYDPAIDYEMQLAASHEKTSKQDKKTSAEKNNQLSKPNQGVVRKVRPSKVNNNKNNLEDARARADKLRSYKADLQKMRKEQQDAEQKRLEALKMERQKRVAARTTNSSRKQLHASSKLSPISRSTKFTDSEPGSSSPLQRSKIRPTSINNSKKPLTSSSRLIDRNHSAAAGNRLTRSLSGTKKEMSSVTDSYKASSSITHIRRLSEPKKINNTHHTTSTKARSAEPVSKPKSSDGPTETKKISAAVDQSKAADLKITSSNPITQKMKVMVKPPVAQVAKLNLNNRLRDADDNPVIDKTVVMLEHNKQPSSITSKELKSSHITGMDIHEVPLPMKTVDKETISVHPQKHPTTSSEVGKEYEAPYARVSSFEDQSTRNSEYAKAPQPKFGGNGTAKAYVFDNRTESKGEFRSLGKKIHTPTPSVHPPQVDTLKSLISQDETATATLTPTPAKKSSRRLFSFRLGLGGEKKVGSAAH